MKRMSKLMSVVMLLTFVSTFVCGEMFTVLARDVNYGEGHYYEDHHNGDKYAPIPETWNQATTLNPEMTGNVVNTAKHPIQAGKTAVNATGNALKSGYNTVKSGVSGLKTGVTGLKGTIGTGVNKFRNAVGEGAHKLGNLVQKDESYVRNPKTGEIVKVQSRTDIMNELGIIKGKNGRYYMKGRKGSVSAEEVEGLISKKEATLAKNETAKPSKSSSSKAATTTMTKVEAMQEIGVVQKGNNYYIDKPINEAQMTKIVETKMNSAGVSKTEAMKRLGIKEVGNGEYKVSRAVKKDVVNEFVAEKMTSAPANQQSAGKKFLGDVKEGYAAGTANAKAITKTTLDFRGKAAWNSLGTAAAFTVGTDIASDLLNGRPLDLKKSAKTVLRREFAGSYVGGALGTAGGAVAQGVCSAIPVVGPVIGAFMPALGGIVGAQVGGNLAGQTRTGNFSLKAALSTIDPVEVAGQAVGGTIGAMLGTMIPIPVVGTAIGGMIGSWVGGKVAKGIQSLFKGKKIRMPNGGGNNNGGGNINNGGTVNNNNNNNNNGQAGDPEQIKAAYQRYVAAYNRLSQLMSEGKGESPEAQSAYAEYRDAKAEYNRLTAGQ